MHTPAAALQPFVEQQLARMKQDLPEAKTRVIVVGLILILFVLNSGCLRRGRNYTAKSDPVVLVKDSRLDINKASAGELERLPGIGRVVADRIIEHRSRYGPFRRVEHIMMVQGISERKFRAMESMITVQPPP